MLRTLAASLALAFMLVGVAPALALQDGRPADAPEDPVVAIVNGTEILQSDVAIAFERLPDQFYQVPIGTLFTQIVQQLIEEGDKVNLREDPAVQAQIEEFARVVIQQTYMNRLIEEGLKEDDLRKTYDETIANTEGPIEVRAQHILLESEEDGYDIIKAIEGGADFGDLARERSLSADKARDGDLGYFTRSAMIQPLSTAAFALEPDTVGLDPVQTEHGWHVIKVLDKRRQPAPTFEESRPLLEQQLTREVIAAHMAELRDKAEITLFNLDGSLAESTPKQ